MSFDKLLLAERIRLMNETKDINLIYDVLLKHFPDLSKEDVMDKYSLKGDFIKNRIFITSKYSDAIVEMLNMTLKLGVKYESISSYELRADLYQFINKVL